MEQLLAGLRAAGEPTRMRLMALCAHGELSVSELTQILGQSQPRVSRHLKLMVEAGLLERFREGAVVFYGLAEQGANAHLSRVLVDLLPTDDEELNRDLGRLESIREKRAEMAQAYFTANAERWDQIRSLHAPTTEVETALLTVIGEQSVEEFLDIGTGTGRILELMAGQVERGVGVDLSTGMLTVARSNLEQANLRNVHVRKADMYNLIQSDNSVDLAIIHQVLHYSGEPEQAIAEAARVLKPGGRLIVVDFYAHDEEWLRSDYQHVKLGFSDSEVQQLFEQCQLTLGTTKHVEGEPLTVSIWQAVKPLEALERR